MSPPIVTRTQTRNFPAILGALCMMAIAAVPSSAQEIAPGTTGVINIYGLVLRFPLPEWVDVSDPKKILDQSNYRRDEQSSHLHIDQIPAHESYDNYKNLYRIAAVRGTTNSLEGAISALIEENRKNCTPGSFAPFASNPVPDGALVTILCGKLAGADNSGLGLILHAMVFQRDTVNIYVTREWRGESFSLSETASDSRPVGSAEFEATSARFLAQTELVNP